MCIGLVAVRVELVALYVKPVAVHVELVVMHVELLSYANIELFPYFVSCVSGPKSIR
jgi:hypothetical protein